ncbi:MAG: geranylgeranyl reductase family protein, partial [Candidatus Syntropharchaeia archaeon]
SEMVIGADGYYSLVARRLGLLQRNIDRIAAQFTYQMEIPSSEIDEKIGDRLELYYGTELSPANIWVCPKREGISLGIGSLLPEITEEKSTLKERLDYFLKNHPIASEKLKNAKPVLEQPSQIFYPGTVSKSYFNGALLAGESAGHTVMATGAGIYWSMVGGDLAAKTAVDAIEKGDLSEKSLSVYEEEVKKEIGRDLELGVKVRTKTSDIEAREKVIESLKADKEARDRFLLMAAGKHPLTEIARFW